MRVLILALIMWPFLGQHGPIQAERYSEGGWTLELFNNTFTGELNCTVKNKAMVVENGALVLEFAKTVDTSAAWFRIGSQQAKPWRSLIPTLRQMGMQLRFDDLDNPSQGRVPIPLFLLMSEADLWISSDETKQPRRFIISGLTSAMERGNSKGCMFQIPRPSIRTDLTR